MHGRCFIHHKIKEIFDGSFFTSRVDLILIFLSYTSLQMGFFKRSDPYGTTMEKAQLKPQASSEA